MSSVPGFGASGCHSSHVVNGFLTEDKVTGYNLWHFTLNCLLCRLFSFPIHPMTKSLSFRNGLCIFVNRSFCTSLGSETLPNFVFEKHYIT